ncbi:hypothetical protein [Chitinophaga sp. sic0106]|uniref:hypothetical protein n=1 Tax=Chitinophaga sp. sic0106 TaxID=2854785 RepID=UPI001C47D2C3|nr:hypothetical protein [Chitinophaga sp. sic0106]MBV7533043.1 hypothetical protein [Chitinophaga sp. sic0106]
MQNNLLPEEFSHMIVYYANINRLITAQNLLAHSGEIFKRAYVYKNFETYRNLTHGPQINLPISEIQEFAFEGVVDKVRITICFENYMKAILLINGYLVHEINPNSNKALNKSAKESPVLATAVLLQSSFVNLTSRNLKQLEITYKTLQLSTLLKPKYQAVIQLPSNILKILSALNEERNKIHFTDVTTFTHGQSVIDEFTELNQFFDKTIYPLIFKVGEDINKLNQH